MTNLNIYLTRILSLVILTSFLALASCAENPSSSPKTKIDPFGILTFADIHNLTGLDTSSVDAVLLCVCGTEYNLSTSSAMTLARAQAIFTQDSAFANVSSVTANGYSLTQGSNVDYTRINPGIYNSGTSTVVWNINGYGSPTSVNFSDTSGIPGPTVPTNHNPMDTLSYSGFTVNYSGGTSSEDLICYLKSDASLTAIEKSDTTYITSRSGRFGYLPGPSGLDNGSFSFTSSQLSVLPDNWFIDLDIDRYSYHVKTLSNGLKVGVLSIFDYDAPFYLH